MVSERHLPVRPDLRRLRAEAEALREQQPELSPTEARRRLAQSYGVASWHRLELACLTIEAIWADDDEALGRLMDEFPFLLHEEARGVAGSWGAPLSYAANLGRVELIELLHERGAQDLQHAFDRACLQGQLEAARLLHSLGARPEPGAMMGPAETQNADGARFLLAHGAEVADAEGDPLAPVALVLETYCRDPEGKHRCLELFADAGVDLPATAPMALHRGRLDLLEALLAEDPALLERTFSHQEIYPPELGCHDDHSLALHGTPLAGATLLHLAVDYDEIEIARWILRQGGDVDRPAVIDDEGFGGHTALFGCVVSQPYRVGLRRDAEFAELLLAHGADVAARASLRKRLRFVADEREHAYHDVSPRQWGERFHDQEWVNPAVLRLLASRGG